MRDTATRIFDVILSAAALLLLSPLLLALVVILRLSGEGEVFFRQQRVGAGGNMFELLKFATMLKASPDLPGGALTSRNDPRILPVGHFLRKTKLNELPQLWNVLNGDMSMIGPRPQAPPHFDIYEPEVKAELVKVRPGLSGIASIVFRDEEDILARASDSENFYGSVIAPYKGKLEVWFVRHRSIALYFELLLLTVWAVLVPSSALHRRVFGNLPAPPSELHGL